MRDSTVRPWVVLGGAGRADGVAAAPTTQATLPSTDHAGEIARIRHRTPEVRRPSRPLPSQGRAGDAAGVVLAAAGYNSGLLLRWLAELLRAIIRAFAKTVPAPKIA